MFDNKSLFGKDFKFILALTLLAGVAYTLPQVQAGLAQANTYGSGMAAQVYSSSSPSPSPSVSCPGNYACVPLSSTPTITVNATNVQSGGGVTMLFTVPLSTVAEKLYMSCPAGVSAMNTSGINICNTWQYVQMLTSQYRVTLTNTSGQVQNVVPSFYAYPATSPTYVVGVSSSISVQPAAGQANISLDPSSPLTASVPVKDTVNMQYIGLPVLVFDVNAQNSNLNLRTVPITVKVSGSGTVAAAYLYQGTTMVMSASVSNGVAVFSNIANGTNGATIPMNTTVPYTVKVDVTGVGSNGMTVQAIVSPNSLTIYDASGHPAIVSGSATGNVQTVLGVGPAFALSGTPTITKTVTNQDMYGNSTTTYAATFNVTIQAVGETVNFGLPSSTRSAWSTATTSFAVYKNGAISGVPTLISYSQPTNTTLSSDGTSFAVLQNQTVTIPVTAVFTIPNSAPNVYAVQMQGITWFTNMALPNTLTNFMLNQPAWRTSSI